MEIQNLKIEDQIRSVLRLLQSGYENRNLEKLDLFMEEIFVQTEDTIIFGAAPNEECIGYNNAKKLVEFDWKFWGGFWIDIDNAFICCSDNMASITTKGSVKCQIPTEHLCNRALGDISEMAKSKISPKEKLLLINDNASKVLLELERGEKHIWSIRLSAVLIKKNGKWLFKQMHFSHPTVTYPGVRILES